MIDELKGRWVGGVQLNPQALSRLKQFVLVTSTGASTRIEGSRLSDKEVEKFMKGLAIQRFSERDKQEVQGYYELLANVFNSWDELHFSESLIKHFHKELLKYVDKDQLKAWEYLQKKLEVTPKELSEKLTIPRPTVNQVLSKLIELKKIERLGQGRSTRYRKK